MSWTEVTILVDRAKLGDRIAYGELVERFRASVFAMAMTKVHDPVEADELTQEVFVHAMRKLPQLREARCFAGWLRKITGRMAINRLTRRGPEFGTDSDVLDSATSNSVDPSEQMAKAEAAAQLHEGLKQLKPLDRETLEAFYIRGQSLKQMSDDFDTPVGTIKRRLHVARQRLKEVLEENVAPDAEVATAKDGSKRTTRERRLVNAGV